MNFTDAEKYCQIVKNSLDQSWLSEKRSKMIQFGVKNNEKQNSQKHHPLASLIHETERTLELENSARTFTISENILRLAKIGVDIDILKQNSVSGIDEKIQSLMSDDYSGIEKLLFEISMASLLVRQKHSVQFLKTCEDIGKRTPDLLVDDSVEFECTKTDMLTDQQKQNQIRLEELGIKILNILNDLDPYCFIFVEYDDEPNEQQISETLNCIRESLNNKKYGKFGIVKGQITINKIFYEKTDDCRIYMKNQNIRYQSQLDLFDELLDLLDWKIGIKEIKDKLRKKTDYDLIRYRISMKNNNPFLGELQYIAIKSGEFPNRLRGVIKRIKEKIDQFSQDKPSLICVNIANISSKLCPEDYRKLRENIDKILSITPKLSSVTLVSEEIIHETNGMNFRQAGVIITNNTASYPLPNNMNFIGLEPNS